MFLWRCRRQHNFRPSNSQRHLATEAADRLIMKSPSAEMLKNRSNKPFMPILRSFSTFYPFLHLLLHILILSQLVSELFSSSLKGRLHGAFSMCVSMSDKPFDAEACDIGGQASATNGLSDIKTHIKNAPCNRPFNRQRYF